MSLVKDMHNPAIDNLIQSCYVHKYDKLEWIPYSQITSIKPTQMDNVYYAIRKQTGDNDEVKETMIMLLLLGNDEICTPTLVSEFARIYTVKVDITVR